MQIKTLNSKSQKNTIDINKLASSYFKCLMNFIQLLSILNSYGFQKNSVEAVFSKTFQALTGSFFSIFSLDCLFENFDSLPAAVYLKSMIISFFPIFLTLIFFSFFFFSRNLSKGYLILICATSSIFLLQPSIIGALFDILSCIKINENNSYISSEMLINCYDNDYFFWLTSYIIPCFLIYSLILPLSFLIFVFVGMKKNKIKMSDEDFNMKFGIFIQGFKRTKYYWDFILLWKKIFLIIFGIFIVNDYIKGVFAIFFLVVIDVIQGIDQPLMTTRLNYFELIGNRSLMIIFLGMILKINNDSLLIEVFSTFLILSTELHFLLLFIKYFLPLKIQLKENLKTSKILNKINKMLESEAKKQDFKEFLVNSKELSFKIPKVKISKRNQHMIIKSPFTDLKKKIFN